MGNVLFLTLKVFSAAGGIEKMSKVLGKALYDLREDGSTLKIISSHDGEKCDDKYFPSNIFRGFNGNKISFVFKSVAEGIKSKVVILSHINLLSVGYLIKILAPKTKLILFAHGIEIWNPLSAGKKKMLKRCDRVWAVSEFTKNRIEELQYVTHKQTSVLNNCLDPYLIESVGNTPSKVLLNYGLTNNNFVLLTVTRLNSEEKYKGYDKVIECLPELLKDHPEMVYLIVGKYDEEEKNRIDKMISSLNLTGKVILAGFVSDEDLVLHYNIAQIFIMPSKGEGFGLVFIEAMFYDVPVIAGNSDGSVDALLNGKLGMLVDPERGEEIVSAIEKVVNNKNSYTPDHDLLMKNFSYEAYKERLHQHLQFVN